jgi:hypothetical protein
LTSGFYGACILLLSFIEICDPCELDGRCGKFREEFDITKLVFFESDDPLFDVSNPFIILLVFDVDLPIVASLFNELDKEDVENTDLISPLMFPLLSLEDSPPVFLSLKLF